MALAMQAGTLMHVSNLYHIPTQSALAQTIVEAGVADGGWSHVDPAP